MGKVEVGNGFGTLGEQLKSARSTSKGGYGVGKLFGCYTDLLAGQHGSVHVLHVVVSKDAELNLASIDLSHGSSLVVGSRGPIETSVGQNFDVLREGLGRNAAQIGIAVAENEGTVGLNGVGKLTELVHIAVEGWEDIDVVPSNASYDGHIGVVVQEFRGAVKWGSKVLIALKDSHF